MSAPAICMIAAIKRHFKRRHWLRRPVIITWCRVFDETSFRENLHNLKYRVQFLFPRASVFVFLYTFATSVSILETILFIKRPTECRSYALRLWFALQIVSIYFYCTFCYFVYLRRKLLEIECAITVDLVKKNIGHWGTCVPKVKNFFREYMQLRQFVFPWLNIIIFSGTFSLAFILTWRMEIHDSIPATNITISQSFQNNGSLPNDFFCLRSCTKEFEKDASLSTIFMIQELCVILIVIVLPVIAVGRLDLKYQWDRFKIKIYLNIDTTEDSWKNLSKLIERLHPDISSESLATIAIPLFGIVAGGLGGHYALWKVINVSHKWANCSYKQQRVRDSFTIVRHIQR